MVEQQDVIEPLAGDTNGRGSLAERAKARRDQLLDRQTVTLEVPGYEGILEVEYRALSYSESRKIVARHQRQRDDAVRELYIAADQLIAASINAYEITGDETRKALECGWGLQLARMLGVEVSEGTTARQAIFKCFARETLLSAHYIEYTEWLSSADAEADQEQRVDFQQTTSSS